MTTLEAIAAVLVVISTLSYTVVVVGVVRESSGGVSRLFANLALPCGLVPLLLALALAGPYAGLGMAALILSFQVISGAAENHIAGRLTWLRETGRAFEEQEPPDDARGATAGPPGRRGAWPGQR